MLLLLTIVPIAGGILLFVGAWANVVVLASSTTQTVAGALLALLGFAASNLLQSRWLLAGGWTALGLAMVLLISSPELWVQVVSGVMGVVGLALLALEFVWQFKSQVAGRR